MIQGSSGNKKNNKTKVLVVGLDGASPRLLDEMIGKSFLPNIASLIRNGSYGRLTSTVPDVTPPSWTSMVTGVDPSKHGIFDFFKFNGGRVERIVTSADRKRKSVWDILSRRGRRVIVVNVPVTYPPQPVNGILISDMLTPEGASEIVYPKYMAPALKNKGYDVGIRWTGGDGVSKKVSSRELAGYVKKRFQFFNWLVSEFPWDFAMVVFNETDFAQHLFPTKTSSLFEVYSEVDLGLGDLLKRIDPCETSLLVTSDHGFNVARRGFRVNDWLAEVGALSVANGGKTSVKKWNPFRALVNVMLKRSFTARMLDKLRAHLPEGWVGSVYTSPASGSLSGLYCPTPQPHAYVSLSLTGGSRSVKDYEALVARLRLKAEKLADRKTGVKPIKRVLTRGEVYDGVYSIEGPDVLLLLAENYVISEKIFGTNDFFYSTVQGIHEPDGVVIGYGRSFARGQKIKSQARVWDIAPTVLELLGVPAEQEEDLDGKSLLTTKGESYPVAEEAGIPAI
jgi:predicted AlkP superfamily phosphohydrolase/phosphomutase